MKRLVCAEWNDAAQTCTTEVWLDEPEPLFPQLTLSETQALITAILVLWAFAYAIRLVIRAANEF